MRIATEAEYNADTRAIEFKLELFLDGRNNEPVIIDGDRFVDLSFLDEACAEGDTPIGTPSSNEVSITLTSVNGLWNPTNVNSPYYGKMNLGVPADLYIRPYVEVDEETGEPLTEEYEWQPLGEFQVTSWTSSITGITADMTLNDKLYPLLGPEITKLPVINRPTMESFIESFFNKNGVSYEIIGTLDQVLEYSYNILDNGSFLKEISFAAFSFIYMNHEGKIVIRELEHISSVDWVIGEEQIINITSKQTAEYKYAGVALTAEQPQLGDLQELLKYTDHPIGALATLVYNTCELKNFPIYAITAAETESDVICTIEDVHADVKDISYTIVNHNYEQGIVTSTIYGYPLSINSFTIDDEASDTLRVSSKYIQTVEEAVRIKGLLSNYVTLEVPTLELSIRGNPLISPGDRVRIFSEDFNIDFVGWVIRQDFRYDGTLSATLTVLSSSVITD